MKRLAAITLLSALVAVACKPSDDGGKHSEKAPIGQAKPMAAGKSSSEPAAPMTILDFKGASGRVSIAADGVQVVRRGDDVSLILPEVRLQKYIGGDVRFKDLRFWLTRRVPTETGNYIGTSDEDSNVSGTLTDEKPFAVFKNAKLTYKGAAPECAKACLITLTVWIQYGNSQSGGLSNAVEISLK